MGAKKKDDIVKGKEPFGLIASAAAPFLGDVAKPLLEKNFGGRGRRRQR